MMLSHQSIKRISAAVRSVERSSGKGGTIRADLLATVLRIAKVGEATEGEPTEGQPYVYAASIYAGHWDDDKAVRPHIYDDGEIWSATELEADAWVAVIRVGGHWEVIGSAGDCDEIRFDDDSMQLQVKKSGTWTMITGGQAVDITDVL